MTHSNQVQARVKVSEIVFRDDLYPRIQTSAVTVQKYAEDLDVLPPIEVNQHNELIDGWHRWTAHKKAEADTIPVVVTVTESDSELLELAIERNAAHGLQLSQEDKRDMARRIYGMTPLAEQGEKKKKLAKILSVSERAVQLWLSRIDKDNREKREAAIARLWFSCLPQDEIAQAVGMSRQGVAKITQQVESFRFVAESGECYEIENEEDRLEELRRRHEAAANHATDFEPPLYNVWKQQERTPGSAHFGNSEVRWVDNLLYLYTKPFDVVVDPFAGGGSTIDVCRKRFRRYFVSDRKPVVEREKEIRQHDIADGLPPLHKGLWKDVGLIYLDPPYWKQAEGEYSDAPTDLGNMLLDDFTVTLAEFIHRFAEKLNGAHIALMLQPTQWRAPERRFTDHVADILRAVNLPVKMRVSVPYESQQCTAQMVDWAKANREILVLTREIIVWEASG